MSGQEQFDWGKFWQGMGSFFNPVAWAKDIAGIFNIRKLLIYTIIIIGVMAFGYYKGYQNRPINVPVQYGREVILKLQDQQLHIDKKGNVYLEDLKGNVIKQLTVKDVTNLKSQLAPYGFMLKPVFIAGIGIGTKDKTPEGELGVGVAWFRAWRTQLETFLTQKGIYSGITYNITDNAGVGIGAGTNYFFNEQRIIIYGRIRF